MFRGQGAALLASWEALPHSHTPATTGCSVGRTPQTLRLAVSLNYWFGVAQTSRCMSERFKRKDYGTQGALSPLQEQDLAWQVRLLPSSPHSRAGWRCLAKGWRYTGAD